VRQFALLLGVSDRRTWRTLDYYEAQTHAQEDFSNVTAVGLGRDRGPARTLNFMICRATLDFRL